MIRSALNTPFVQRQGAYLHLDHGTVVVRAEGNKVVQVPLHHLSTIAVFGNVLVSPFLIHECADEGRTIVLFDEHGRFKARITGSTKGNVLLRMSQFTLTHHPHGILRLASRIIEGKIRGQRMVLQRNLREYGDAEIGQAVSQLALLQSDARSADDIDVVRGIEGGAARCYFRVFSRMIRAAGFTFAKRSRRPPRDPTNACLSFVYALLLNDCTSAVEAVGLDPQIGFLHGVRPGRPSLALDLMEEFRAPLADRLVLALVNRGQLKIKDFEERPGGAVTLTRSGRRTVLIAYQQRKQDEISHGALKEPIPIGLLFYVQAQLLARFIRGDLKEYMPYHWR